MSADPGGITVPSDAAAIARRSRRLGNVVTFLFVSALVATSSDLPLVTGLLVVVVVGLLRVPIFRISGTAQLTSSADPTSVRTDFESVPPPLFGFQWGIADQIEPTDDGATDDSSYLFGLRSARMEVENRSQPTTHGDLELNVTTNGKPWGTYDLSIHEMGRR